MEVLEKQRVIQEIVSSPIGAEDGKQMISPVNSDKDLKPLDPAYQKSRMAKSKRFNSTNAKYKHPSNKIDKESDNMSALRKWSQCT